MPRNEYICDCNAINQKTVEAVQKVMPEKRFFDVLSDFYKVLGDNTRCRMIFALKQKEMCVCDLANVLSMSKSSVSHQLANMRTRGLVKCRREGKTVFYSLDDKHVSDIFDTTITHIKHKMEE